MLQEYKNIKQETKKKTFKKKTTNNRNTGYPAQDPTANIYIYIYI